MATPREEIEAAVAEIHRLAKLRIAGSIEYDPSEWCGHGGRDPNDRTDSATRLKLECRRCIEEIITGAARANADPGRVTFARERG